MSIFNTEYGGGVTAQTNDRAGLNYTNDKGTAELRAYVNNNIISNSPDTDRIIRYQLYWLFYGGKHWRAYNDTFLSFNYVKAFIDKVNSFLLGPKGFSFDVVSHNDEEVPEVLEKAGEALIDAIWRNNKKIQTQYEIMQMGSVCGDVWIHLEYKVDDAFPDEEDRKLYIHTLDSRHCFPEFLNGDITRLEAFTMRQPLGLNVNKYQVMCRRYTTNKVQTWFQRDTSATPETIKYQMTEVDNPYRFIPVVHIKNKPQSDGYWGTSDMQNILKINKIYNEHAQNVKDVMDYYAEPTTVVTGGTVKSITRGVGRIWSGLPAEANVFNLSLGEDMNSSLQFMAILKQAMHELSDVPENALGKLQAISNTSAAALQITYQPLIQQADFKAITYSEGFAKLHKMMIKMIRLVEPQHPLFVKLPVDFERNYSVVPVYTYGLPSDRMVDLQEAQMELMLKLNTKRNIMNRLGMKNVPQLIKEIDAEALKDADLEAEIIHITGTAEMAVQAAASQQTPGTSSNTGNIGNKRRNPGAPSAAPRNPASQAPIR